MTRGVGAGGVPPPADPRPTVIIAVSPLPIFPPAIYENGLTAHVVSGRRNERAMTAGLKTLAYTDAVAAWIEAQRAGADEALFLDTEEHCSEATSSNLFVWTGNVLVTPPISCGCCRGSPERRFRARRRAGCHRRAPSCSTVLSPGGVLTSRPRRGAARARRRASIGRGGRAPDPSARRCLHCARRTEVGRECARVRSSSRPSSRPWATAR